MLRKQFMLKPKIQLKYLFITVGLICLTGCSVYFVFWSSMVSSVGLEQLSSGEWMALERAYNSSFLWVILILALAVSVESVLLFHRLIGPVFVIERMMKSLAEGDLTVNIYSRKRDELKDVVSGFQAMISNMRKAVTDDRSRIENINQLIDQNKLPEAKEKLSGLTKWFKV